MAGAGVPGRGLEVHPGRHRLLVGPPGFLMGSKYLVGKVWGEGGEGSANMWVLLNSSLCLGEAHSEATLSDSLGCTRPTPPGNL